jgi:hypothetical protein
MAKVGRNDPCPCGSGKKFKKCCLGKETGAPVDAGVEVLDSPAPVEEPLDVAEDDVDFDEALFPNERDRILADRIEHAEATADSGKRAAADAEFEDIARDYPSVAEVYAAWGTILAYDEGSDTDPADLDRAEAVYRRGLEECGGADVRLRLGLNEVAAFRLAARPQPPAYRLDADLAELARCGGRVPEALVARILARGREVVPLLNRVMLEAEAYLVFDDGDENEAASWMPCHAAFLAAAIGDPSSVDPVLHVGTTDVENDYLHSGFAWFPVAFGPEPVPRFLDFAVDRTVFWYHQAQAIDGVVWAAGLHPDLRPQVAGTLADAMSTGVHDGIRATWLAVAALRTDDPAALDAVRQALTRGAVDTGVTGRSVDERSEPGDWFLSREPVHDTTDAYFAALRRRAVDHPAISTAVPMDFAAQKRAAHRRTTRKAQRKARKQSKGKRR